MSKAKNSSSAAAAAATKSSADTPPVDSAAGCAGCGADLDPDDLLQCPKCRELGLPPALFCGQDCFTVSWAAHKAAHDVCCIHSFPPDARPPGGRYKFSGGLRDPGLLSPKRTVPKAIARPDYASHREGRSLKEERQYKSGAVPVMAADELTEMRRLCRHGREILNKAAAAVKPGATTDEIDRLVHDETVARGLYPSTLNYMGFPKSLCTSLNEVVCHGIPSSQVIEADSIVNLDISAYGGATASDKRVVTDLNETVFASAAAARGDNGAATLRLVFAAFECMVAGMHQLRPGGLYKHVGGPIEARAKLDGFSVARGVYSHGVGCGGLFHHLPDIPHYGGNKTAGAIKAGNVVTIEPMVNAGGHDTRMWPDDWTVVTADGKWSAQFENSCLLVEPAPAFDGSWLPCEILTSLTAPQMDRPLFLQQLEAWSIPMPRSRLPEIGLPPLPEYILPTPSVGKGVAEDDA